MTPRFPRWVGDATSESTHFEQLKKILADPDCPDAPLVFEGTAFRSARSGKRYPVRADGYVDFVSPDAVAPPSPPLADGGGIIFRLNEYYNRHFEQRIAKSVFAGGGIAAWFMDRRIKAWLAEIDGLLVDVGCGDRKTELLLGPRSRYIGLDFLPVTQYSPWRTAYPDINADALNMPLRSGAADCVLNLFVLEHVTDPARLINELCRVVKPGGIVVLAGPGDILMSHGEPYNFFNMTRYAYRMLLENNGMVIEDEYYPSRFWVSMTGLLYNYFVRNDFYNGGPLRKALQMAMLGLSLPISPVANIVAQALDSLLPFDRRGYSTYMVRAKKPTTPSTEGAD